MGDVVKPNWHKTKSAIVSANELQNLIMENIADTFCALPSQDGTGLEIGLLDNTVFKITVSVEKIN